MDGDVCIGFLDRAEFARVSSWKQGVYIYICLETHFHAQVNLKILASTVFCTARFLRAFNN